MHEKPVFEFRDLWGTLAVSQSVDVHIFSAVLISSLPQTMMEYLKARKRIKEPQVRGLMRQVIKGCLHLRERNVIHR